MEKKTGINLKAREKIIKDFLQREGLRHDPEVTKMLVDTDYKITADKLQMKSMENRLRKLKDEPQIPYTTEEEMYLRMQKLGVGGKSRRPYRGKTRKQKIHGKRQTYRRK